MLRVYFLYKQLNKTIIKYDIIWNLSLKLFLTFDYIYKRRVNYINEINDTLK